MKQVSAADYVKGVESIYEEHPSYKTGGDGSDGVCDCIGMCRGGLERAGASDVTNMRGTNQAARKTIQNIEPLISSAGLMVGDVVLKVRDKDDKTMPLPDRYRKGGADYDPTWGETNFTHIGTVTGINPLEITHMTSPTAKKDKSIKNWSYLGELPWVKYGEVVEPPDEPDLIHEPEPLTATVFAETGKTVNLRKSPSMGSALVERVPVGSVVEVLSYGESWCNVKYRWFKGFMMTAFLIFEETETYTVTIPHLSKPQAEALISQYPDSTIMEERG